jgi:hypothetical protein
MHTGLGCTHEEHHTLLTGINTPTVPYIYHLKSPDTPSPHPTIFTKGLPRYTRPDLELWWKKKAIKEDSMPMPTLAVQTLRSLIASGRKPHQEECILNIQAPAYWTGLTRHVVTVLPRTWRITEVHNKLFEPYVVITIREED